MKSIQFLLVIFITFLYSQDCNQLKELYDSDNLLDAYELSITNSENINTQECQFLSFNIAFDLENFDQAKGYLDILLKNHSANSQYLKSSRLLTKVLQDYKAAKYTLERIDIDEAIEEYKQKIQDEELSQFSIFYSGLAIAYKMKDKQTSQSDTLMFDMLDLAIENYKIAHSKNKYKGYNEEILNISKYLAQKGKNSKDDEDYNSAMLYLKKSIEYSPNFSLAHFWLGELYFRITDFQLAIKSLETGLGTKLKDGNPIALNMLGKCYETLGKLEVAKQYYQYAINNKPSSPSYRLALANILFKLQKFSDAKSTLLDIIVLDPSYIKAYEFLVKIFIELKDYNKAREYSDKGLQISKKSYILYAQIAFLNNESNKYLAAIENSDKALSIKRKYGPALLELAKANVYLCNKVNADDAFKRAKSYDRQQVNQLKEWATAHYKTFCK